MTPRRIGAVTGNGASSANRSRGVSSFSAITRVVSARSVGRSGRRDVSSAMVIPYSMRPGSTALRYVCGNLSTNGDDASRRVGTFTPRASSSSTTAVNRRVCHSG